MDYGSSKAFKSHTNNKFYILQLTSPILPHFFVFMCVCVFASNICKTILQLFVSAFGTFKKIKHHIKISPIIVLAFFYQYPPKKVTWSFWKPNVLPGPGRLRAMLRTRHPSARRHRRRLHGTGGDYRSVTGAELGGATFFQKKKHMWWRFQVSYFICYIFILSATFWNCKCQGLYMKAPASYELILRQGWWMATRSMPTSKMMSAKQWYANECAGLYGPFWVHCWVVFLAKVIPSMMCFFSFSIWTLPCLRVKR